MIQTKSVGADNAAQRRHASLLAALGLCASLSASPAGAVVPVTNCNDSGVGSLRDAVSSASALNGDTVDLTQLTCSNISLRTGAIVIERDDLTLSGPGAARFVIDGKYGGRVIEHRGSGTLTISGLSLVDGGVSSNDQARGGCVYSAGSVHLYGVAIAHCSAIANLLSARGGAVYGKSNVYVSSSIVSNAKAQSYGNAALGGGIAAGDGFVIQRDSTIAGNTAIGAMGSATFGGGAYGHQGAVAYSTLSGNSCSGTGGALAVRPKALGNGGNYRFRIDESTISGNTAGGFVGGVYSNETTIVYQSTIAYNTAVVGAANVGGAVRTYAAGLAVTHDGAQTVNLNGNLISSNVILPTQVENDFSADGATVTGDLNLVRVTSSSIGGRVIAGVCPLLGPLRDNGGATFTHALLSGSPAIDAGASTFFNLDQRRVARRSGAMDLGAYELQHGDAVFAAGFDGCPGL